MIKNHLRRNPWTAVYLISLAVCDNGLLLFFLITDTLPTDAASVKENYAYSAFFSWFGFPSFFFFIVASIWLLVLVTFNRYIMIAFPTKANIYYTKFRTYGSIAAVFILSFLINIPHFFTYHPAKQRNGSYKLELTTYGQSDGSKKYELWVHCIVLVLVPWFTIAVLNALIILKLKRQMQKFKKSMSFYTSFPLLHLQSFTKNNDTNSKFSRKVTFLMYTEMVNFRSQSLKVASKQKPHRGLDTSLPS